ncbi:MAG: 23S rRNA (pseudouridine(1915)-N(3))-methyltransferase RlmH [Legionellaceae bacterium]|nr:23S rRNA (pseudouridine(1915)-N(3))-methyltransferase RlmH [Legionellaceae bacterium]
MPDWVYEATAEYQKRLQEFCHFSILEVPLQKRSKTSQMDRIMAKESQTLLHMIPAQSYCIGLDSHGKKFTSEQLATHLDKITLRESQWSLIIGGPEGLHTAVKQRCQEQWSLSDLTFAHPLARIILCEALYRSFAILHHHPYHK